MKQRNKQKIRQTDLVQWLEQFDTADVVLKMAETCQELAIIIVDHEQKVLLWNRGAEILSGLNQEQMTGQPCPQACQVGVHKKSTQESVRLTQADGQSIDVEKYSHVLSDRQGEFAGGIVILKTGSEREDQAPLADSSRFAKQTNFQGIISRSPAMRPVFQLIQNAAQTEATVLVRGESGSGKELVARAIHDLSPRHKAPFLAINCAALSATLLESELFGHVRGAFTGAIRDHSGLFQRAGGGTLFLDEVAEMPPQLQAKLLRVIQERNYLPVGATQAVNADVRLVAATHRSLREEVKKGNFREDLMYRLRVVPIFIPPLRERREDINLLLWHFIKQHNRQGIRHIDDIEPQAMRVLLDHAWPGNIRELQNVVEYAFAVGRGPVLHLSELPPEFRELAPVAGSASNELDDLALSADEEAALIRQALQQTHGKISVAARRAGMSRATFWRKRKLYGI